MNKSSLFLLGAGAAIVLSGCSKKLTAFTSDNFKVNPTPLEVVGEKVPATITANIPAKFFVKDAEVVVTPYLVFNNQELAGNALKLQGEKVRGNAQVVSYDYGGTVTLPVRYNYQPEMQTSELWLDFLVNQGSKTYVLPRVKVDHGIVSTATLASAATVEPAVTPDKFQRVINEKVTADINFLINQTNIRATELQRDDVKNLQATIKDTQGDAKREIEEINISSYASPEGGVKLNTRIAEGREKSTQAYLNKQLKADNVTDFGTLTADFTAQDWEGFQRLVSESNIQDKELILSVLSMYKDPEEREREIRNLSSVFDQLTKDVLPKLRYSRLTASINTIGKSDDELRAAYASNPRSLTVDELLYTATLTNDNNEKAKIYKSCTEIYPEDYRGYNNLGLAQYKQGKFSDAAKNFDKAAKLNPSASEIKMNQGLVKLVDGKYSEANQLLGSAAGAAGLGDALGVYYIKQGDYTAAVRAFGDSKSNNAALAQILTKDYSKAKQTLASVATPDATTYYLQAVLGARTNNEKMATSNLRQAIKLDSSLANKAKADLEFSKVNLSSVF